MPARIPGERTGLAARLRSGDCRDRRRRERGDTGDRDSTQRERHREIRDAKRGGISFLPSRMGTINGSGIGWAKGIRMSIEMGREERDILDAGIDTLTREGVYLDGSSK